MIEISQWSFSPGTAQCQCCGEIVEGGLIWSDAPASADDTILVPRDPSRSGGGSWVIHPLPLAEHQLDCKGIPRDVAREVSAVTRPLETFSCCAQDRPFVCTLLEGHDGPHEARNGDHVAHRW